MESFNNQEEISRNSDEKIKRKGHGPVYWIIVIVGVTFIIAASFNVGMKLGKMAEGNDSLSDNKSSEQNSNREENNSNETSNVNSNVEGQPKEVSQETINKLKDIIGVNDQWIQYLLTSVQGSVNEKLNTANKQILIYTYAQSHNMFIEIKGNCGSLGDTCDGLLNTNYDSIVKSYGITDAPNTLTLGTYNNYYLFTSGLGSPLVNTKQSNFNATYNGNDVVLTTDCVQVSSDNKTIKKSVTYTFKLNNENNYYLYSVASKDV